LLRAEKKTKGEQKMKLEDRITIERAIGLIEGASFAAAPEIQQALCYVVEMLDEVMSKAKVLPEERG
jgi:hypothetical protein